MKRVIVVAAGLVILSSVLSCYAGSWVIGSGHVITEERDVSEFHAVDLRGVGKLYVTQGEVQKLVVTTDDNIMPILRTDVRNGKLIVYTEPGVRHITTLEVHVTMVRVKSLHLSGSGLIEGRNQIRTDRLQLTISGSGDASLDVMAKEVMARLSGSGKMRLNLDAGTLESKISGSGGLFLTGRSQTHRFDASGAGKLRAFDFLTENTAATISGSGNCEVNVSNRLNVKISGSGSVLYKGRPEIESRISGSGNIQSAG